MNENQKRDLAAELLEVLLGIGGGSRGKGIGYDTPQTFTAEQFTPENTLREFQLSKERRAAIREIYIAEAEQVVTKRDEQGNPKLSHSTFTPTEVVMIGLKGLSYEEATTFLTEQVQYLSGDPANFIDDPYRVANALLNLGIDLGIAFAKNRTPENRATVKALVDAVQKFKGQKFIGSTAAADESIEETLARETAEAEAGDTETKEEAPALA